MHREYIFVSAMIEVDLKGDNEKNRWDLRCQTQTCSKQLVSQAERSTIPYTWSEKYENIAVLFTSLKRLSQRTAQLLLSESEAGNVILLSDNLSVETMKKWQTPTGCRCGVLFVILLMPLYGAVIAQHHLPQSLTEIRQAGNVAVKGDMLPTERDERKRNQGQTWSFIQDKTCYYESSNCDAYYIII